MGSLEVVADNATTAAWSKSGHQGDFDLWRSGTVSLGSANTFKFVITRGGVLSSNAAISTVTIVCMDVTTPQSPPPPGYVAPSPPSGPFYYDWESGTSPNWLTEGVHGNNGGVHKGDADDRKYPFTFAHDRYKSWSGPTRGPAGVDSYGRGLARNGGQGNYWLASTSGCGKWPELSYAWNLEYKGMECPWIEKITFMYSMYGFQIGTLKVNVGDTWNEGGVWKGRTVWERSGEQQDNGTYWLTAEVPMDKFGANSHFTFSYTVRPE